MAGTESSQTSDRFDYIIVGGGTAGLVVASRLSEDSSVSVLAVEAGPDNRSDPAVLTPGLVAALYGRDQYDWNFLSVPQASLNNRQIVQPRGRMLGGSSSLNYMMMLYPSRASIDAWASLGNAGWDYDSLTPYFRKFATVHTPPQAARDVVGLTYHDQTIAAGEGPVQVSWGEGYGPTNSAWMETFAGLGLEVKTDPRTGTALGAFQNPATIDPATKTRSSAATAYYSEAVARRPNLVVMTETLVSRVLFDTCGDEVLATGVEILTEDGSTRLILANAEVILAAGALQTPQILELSGIGGRDLLEKHGIPAVIDNPGVGENLQDHPIVCQSYEVVDGVPSADMLRHNPEMAQAVMGMYQATGGGPIGQSTISVAYTPLVDGSGPLSADATASLLDGHSSESDGQKSTISMLRSGEAAIQYLLFPLQITIGDKPTSLAELGDPSRPQCHITVMTILSHPLSRGSVHIASSSVKAAPVWDPKYNSNDLDMEVLARAVQFVERIVDPATPFGKLLKAGGSRMPEIAGHDLDKAKEIVRQRQISVFHVAGSCPMLPREKGGVVDTRLRVYGTKNLRVVDASVFPLEPAGNIQSVVYAVAERAADLIREDWLKARAS